MASNNAALVAHKVAEKVRGGELVNMGKIIKEVGYSDSISKSPTKVTKTKTYRKLAVPLIEGMQEQITKFKEAIAKKDLNNEELRVLMYSMDTFVKNYQLLSGGATERQVFVMPSEIMDRNNLKPSEEKPLLDNGELKP